MKITPKQLEHMRSAIAPLDTPAARQQYEAAKLSDKRYRWDLMYAAGLTRWTTEVLYPSGSNDTHIDTALRTIVPPLSKGASRSKGRSYYEQRFPREMWRRERTTDATRLGYDAWLDHRIRLSRDDWLHAGAARTKRALSVGDTHMLSIARDNFRNPAKAKFLGGPSPSESRAIIKRLTGKDPGPVTEDPRLPGYQRTRTASRAARRAGER